MQNNIRVRLALAHAVMALNSQSISKVMIDIAPMAPVEEMYPDMNLVYPCYAKPLNHNKRNGKKKRCKNRWR